MMASNKKNTGIFIHAKVLAAVDQAVVETKRQNNLKKWGRSDEIQARLARELNVSLEVVPSGTFPPTPQSKKAH